MKYIVFTESYMTIRDSILDSDGSHFHKIICVVFDLLSHIIFCIDMVKSDFIFKAETSSGSNHMLVYSIAAEKQRICDHN